MAVLLGVGTSHKNVINVYKKEILESPADLFHESLAFLRPKGMRRNSNSPKGVVTGVLGTSAAATGI